MEKIAVIGLGMLGCSLCASLEGTCIRLGWSRRPEVSKWARETGLIEEDCPSVEDALTKADLAVLCLPVPVIMEFFCRYAELMKKTLVTDIGSVKGCIEKAAVENAVRFVGSHPMAGTEKSGPEALVRGIYAGATVFIVPPQGVSEVGVTREKRGDLLFVFLGLVRASGIDEHTSWSDAQRTGVKDVGLQLHKGGEFFLVPVPPRVWASAKDARVGAWRIDKNLVEESADASERRPYQWQLRDNLDAKL